MTEVATPAIVPIKKTRRPRIRKHIKQALTAIKVAANAYGQTLTSKVIADIREELEAVENILGGKIEIDQEGYPSYGRPFLNITNLPNIILHNPSNPTQTVDLGPMAIQFSLRGGQINLDYDPLCMKFLEPSYSIAQGNQYPHPYCKKLSSNSCYSSICLGRSLPTIRHLLGKWKLFPSVEMIYNILKFPEQLEDTKVKPGLSSHEGDNNSTFHGYVHSSTWWTLACDGCKAEIEQDKVRICPHCRGVFCENCFIATQDYCKTCYAQRYGGIVPGVRPLARWYGL